MKFIHTADWHLGKLFYGQTLTEEQAWVLKNQFLPLVEEEKPDAIILAGDVYDRSVPPAEAVDLFDEMVSEIVLKRHIPFLVISGNHDSAERLSFASALLREAGLYMCGDLTRTAAPIFLEDEWGPIAFAPLPFAEPGTVRLALGDETIRGYEESEKAQSDAVRKAIPAGTRAVAIAHAFVAGGAPSDSERPLSIGGSDQVPAEIFAPYAYTALGHLHGPQKVGYEKVRYSGSLLKYSFGEAGQKKGCLVVTIDGEGQETHRFVPLTARRDVRIMKGFFDDLMGREGSDDFLLARLEDKRPVIDAIARLRGKYPHVMAMEMPNRLYEDSGSRDNARVGKVTDEELLRVFVKETRDGDGLSEEEEDYMKGIWEEMRKEDVQ